MSLVERWVLKSTNGGRNPHCLINMGYNKRSTYSKNNGRLTSIQEGSSEALFSNFPHKISYTTMWLYLAIRKIDITFPNRNYFEGKIE
jgi:hypothetical protein